MRTKDIFEKMPDQELNEELNRLFDLYDETEDDDVLAELLMIGDILEVRHPMPPDAVARMDAFWEELRQEYFS